MREPQILLKGITMILDMFYALASIIGTGVAVNIIGEHITK